MVGVAGEGVSSLLCCIPHTCGRPPLLMVPRRLRSWLPIFWPPLTSSHQPVCAKTLSPSLIMTARPMDWRWWEKERERDRERYSGEEGERTSEGERKCVGRAGRSEVAVGVPCQSSIMGYRWGLLCSRREKARGREMWSQTTCIVPIWDCLNIFFPEGYFPRIALHFWGEIPFVPLYFYRISHSPTWGGKSWKALS